MPVTYALDGRERIIRTRCIGFVTLEETRAHFGELERDPDSAGSLDVLLDLSETTSLPKTSQLPSVVNEIARLREKVRFEAFAIVAPTDVLFGTLRMFEVMAERFFRVTHVFRTTAEAEAWLAEQRQSSQVAGRSEASPPPRIIS